MDINHAWHVFLALLDSGQISHYVSVASPSQKPDRAKAGGLDGNDQIHWARLR